jgi:hypothetical protein
MNSRLFCLLLPIVCSCLGTTGGELVNFDAAAVGPVQAVQGAPLEFDTDQGWHVSLTMATLHVGAVYLNRVKPASGAGNVPCIMPSGTYVAEVTEGMDVDLLSPVPQRFPVRGDGSTIPALTAQIWLASVPINVVSDSHPVLQLQGTADKASDIRPFTASITIAGNRVPAGSAQAGEKTICDERIVSPILPAPFALETTGSLVLRVDPTLLFSGVDFSSLPSTEAGYAFSNGDAKTGLDPDQASKYLYNNLHGATGGLYSFEWAP